MKQHIAHIAVVVDDYDKAIEFYTQKLNFVLLEDTVLSETKRWVLIAPKGSTECKLLLAKASNEALSFDQPEEGAFCFQGRPLMEMANWASEQEGSVRRSVSVFRRRGRNRCGRRTRRRSA